MNFPSFRHSWQHEISRHWPKIVTSFVILKTVLFTLMHNTFRLPPINRHDMNRRAAEHNFNLTECRQRKDRVYKTCRPRRPLGSPVPSRWPCWNLIVIRTLCKQHNISHAWRVVAGKLIWKEWLKREEMRITLICLFRLYLYMLWGWELAETSVGSCRVMCCVIS